RVHRRCRGCTWIAEGSSIPRDDHPGGDQRGPPDPRLEGDRAPAQSRGQRRGGDGRGRPGRRPLVPTVTQAVEALVRATVDMPDAEMDRSWVWREYDEEGLRFALLLAQHELRDLAVRMSALRRAPATQAELILAKYHEAYRDLTGALAGVHDEDLDRAPAAEEWPVREVIRHMVGAEYGFLGVVQYARSPERPADAARAEAGLSGFRQRRGY